MNLLADESVERQIVERLRQDEHNVLYVAEMEPGIADTVVLQRADENAALLLTGDKDFGELVFRLGQANHGVVLIRLGGTPAQEKAEIVSETLAQRGPQMAGSFSVISSGMVRIRRSQVP